MQEQHRAQSALQTRSSRATRILSQFKGIIRKLSKDEQDTYPYSRASSYMKPYMSQPLLGLEPDTDHDERGPGSKLSTSLDLSQAEDLLLVRTQSELQNEGDNHGRQLPSREASYSRIASPSPPPPQLSVRAHTVGSAKGGQDANIDGLPVLIQDVLEAVSPVLVPIKRSTESLSVEPTCPTVVESRNSTPIPVPTGMSKKSNTANTLQRSTPASPILPTPAHMFSSITSPPPSTATASKPKASRPTTPKSNAKSPILSLKRSLSQLRLNASSKINHHRDNVQNPMSNSKTVHEPIPSKTPAMTLLASSSSTSSLLQPPLIAVPQASGDPPKHAQTAPIPSTEFSTSAVVITNVISTSTPNHPTSADPQPERPVQRTIPPSSNPFPFLTTPTSTAGSSSPKPPSSTVSHAKDKSSPRIRLTIPSAAAEFSKSMDMETITARLSPTIIVRTPMPLLNLPKLSNSTGSSTPTSSSTGLRHFVGSSELRDQQRKERERRENKAGIAHLKSMPALPIKGTGRGIGGHEEVDDMEEEDELGEDEDDEEGEDSGYLMLPEDSSFDDSMRSSFESSANSNSVEKEKGGGLGVHGMERREWSRSSSDSSYHSALGDSWFGDPSASASAAAATSASGSASGFKYDNGQSVVVVRQPTPRSQAHTSQTQTQPGRATSAYLPDVDTSRFDLSFLKSTSSSPPPISTTTSTSSTPQPPNLVVDGKGKGKANVMLDEDDDNDSVWTDTQFFEYDDDSYNYDSSKTPTTTTGTFRHSARSDAYSQPSMTTVTGSGTVVGTNFSRRQSHQPLPNPHPHSPPHPQSLPNPHPNSNSRASQSSSTTKWAMSGSPAISSPWSAQTPRVSSPPGQIQNATNSNSNDQSDYFALAHTSPYSPRSPPIFIITPSPRPGITSPRRSNTTNVTSPYHPPSSGDVCSSGGGIPNVGLTKPRMSKRHSRSLVDLRMIENQERRKREEEQVREEEVKELEKMRQLEKVREVKAKSKGKGKEKDKKEVEKVDENADDDHDYDDEARDKVTQTTIIPQHPPSYVPPSSSSSNGGQGDGTLSSGSLKRQKRLSTTASHYLRRRRSMPMFDESTPPPPYPNFLPSPSKQYQVMPREDEGKEQLPPYSNNICLKAIMPMKMEFSAPGVQAKDRRWKRVLFVLNGTSLKVYKCPPGITGVGVIGEWWESKVGAGDVSLQPAHSGVSNIQIETREDKKRFEQQRELERQTRRHMKDADGVGASGEQGDISDGDGQMVLPIPPSRPPPQPIGSNWVDLDEYTGTPRGSSSTSNPTPSKSRFAQLLKPGKHSRSRSDAMSSERTTPEPSPRPSLNVTRGDASTPLSGRSNSPFMRTQSPVSGSSHSLVAMNPQHSSHSWTSSLSSSGSTPEQLLIRKNQTVRNEASNTKMLYTNREKDTVPDPDTGDLIKEYTMQQGESGLGNDYSKRKNVIRLRLEGEQFLLQARDVTGVIEWIEALQASANIALDLDERQMPRPPMFPRRRRRRRAQVAQVQPQPQPQGGS